MVRLSTIKEEISVSFNLHSLLWILLRAQGIPGWVISASNHLFCHCHIHPWCCVTWSSYLLWDVQPSQLSFSLISLLQFCTFVSLFLFYIVAAKFGCQMFPVFSYFLAMKIWSENELPYLPLGLQTKQESQHAQAASENKTIECKSHKFVPKFICRPVLWVHVRVVVEGPPPLPKRELLKTLHLSLVTKGVTCERPLRPFNVRSKLLSIFQKTKRTKDARVGPEVQVKLCMLVGEEEVSLPLKHEYEICLFGTLPSFITQPLSSERFRRGGAEVPRHRIGTSLNYRPVDSTSVAASGRFETNICTGRHANIFVNLYRDFFFCNRSNRAETKQTQNGLCNLSALKIAKWNTSTNMLTFPGIPLWSSLPCQNLLEYPLM